MKTDIELGEVCENPISSSLQGGLSPEADERSSPVHFRRGQFKDQTLKQKLENLEKIMKDDEDEKGVSKIRQRYEKFLRKTKEKSDNESLHTAVIAFKYATDLSYMRRSDPDQVLSAVKRREAWAQAPMPMIIVSATQVILCLIVLLTQNSPVNSATIFMALLYIFSLSTYNPFDVTKDLLKMIQDFDKKYLTNPIFKIVAVVVNIFLLPLWIVVFGTTMALDLMVGEILDISYGEMINILVNFVVVFTGFSVGIRSGNAVNAIQTFAGFSFIGELDELVLDNYEIDMYALTSHKHGKGKARKILTVRLIIYFSIPALFAFFMYITVTNKCMAFCNVGN